jgi:hypothetical protein
LAALVFSGCGEVSANAVNVPPGDSPDPCTLASDADLEAITGRVPARHVSEPFAGKSQCTWYDNEGYIHFVVAIKEARFFEEPLKSELRYAPVTGVGEDAYLSSGASVYVSTPKLVFYAQSLYPAADAEVSEAVRTAESLLADPNKYDVLVYEAGYRLGKLVVGKL